MRLQAREAGALQQQLGAARASLAQRTAQVERLDGSLLQPLLAWHVEQDPALAPALLAGMGMGGLAVAAGMGARGPAQRGGGGAALGKVRSGSSAQRGGALRLCEELKSKRVFLLSGRRACTSRPAGNDWD